MTYTMLRIRGMKDMGIYKNLRDEQIVIGWDNLLRGKFSKEWRKQQKAYKTRQRLQDPVEYDRIKRKKKGRKRKIRTKTNIRKSQTK